MTDPGLELVVGGVQVAHPLRGRPPDEVFRDLGAHFGWHADAVKWVIDSAGLGARSVDDFVYAISTESEVKAMVEAMSLPGSLAYQQVSRVRQAWTRLS